MAPPQRSAIRGHRTAAAAAALCAVLALAACAAPALAGRLSEPGPRRGRSLLQENPAVPTECINTGLALQSACTKELELASSAFGLSPTANIASIKVDPAKLRAYLATAPAPTSSCCTAAASFNNAYCSCSDSVLELVKSFTSNDIEAYSEVAQYLSNRCKEVGTDFTLYYKDTCPAQKP